MTKRKAPEDGLGDAVNRTDDLTQQIITAVDVYDAEGDPRVSVMALHTPAGHYQFILAEPIANEIIQQLRDFIAGDSDRLP